MKWMELSAQTDAEGAEAAAALLNEWVKGGAVIEQTVTPEPGVPFDPARAFSREQHAYRLRLERHGQLLRCSGRRQNK